MGGCLNSKIKENLESKVIKKIWELNTG
jgi:hypothetical protein